MDLLRLTFLSIDRVGYLLVTLSKNFQNHISKIILWRHVANHASHYHANHASRLIPSFHSGELAQKNDIVILPALERVIMNITVANFMFFTHYNGFFSLGLGTRHAIKLRWEQGQNGKDWPGPGTIANPHSEPFEWRSTWRSKVGKMIGRTLSVNMVAILAGGNRWAGLVHPEALNAQPGKFPVEVGKLF